MIDKYEKIYKIFIEYMDNVELRIFSYFKNQQWFEELKYKEKITYTKKYLNLYLEKYYKLPNIVKILDSTLNDKQKKLLIEKYQLIAAISPLEDVFMSNIESIYNIWNEYLKENSINGQMSDLRINIKSNLSEKEILLKRVEGLNYDNDVKEYINHKISCITNFNPTDKYYKWVDFVLKIPKDIKSPLIEKDPEELILDFYEKINEEAYGLKEIKEEILCCILDLASNGNKSHQSIGLLGPPGVGKTMIITCLSKLFNYPLIKIQLGGLTDGCVLLGHEFTYSSSEAGIITKNLVRLKTNKCIICLDELDKVSKADKGREINDALNHITDFTQNHSFRDTWVGDIPIDLSGCMFFYTFNDLSVIDQTLLSRMLIIKTNGYTIDEKILIVNKYMFPKFLKNNNLTEEQIILNDETIRYLFNKIYNSEDKFKSGLRELTLFLNKIIKRIKLYSLVINIHKNKNILKELTFNIPNFQFPYTITINFIDQLMNENNNKEHEILNSMYS